MEYYPRMGLWNGWKLPEKERDRICRCLEKLNMGIETDNIKEKSGLTPDWESVKERKHLHPYRRAYRESALEKQGSPDTFYRTENREAICRVILKLLKAEAPISWGMLKKEDIIPLVYFPFRKSGGADSGGGLRQSSASCDLWRKNEIFMEPWTRSGGLCCLSDGREGEKADRRYLSSGNCQRSPGGAGGTNQSFLC